MLSIAVLGAAMTSAFAFRLNRSLATLAIPEQALHEIQSNEIRLAALKIPEGIDAQRAAAIETSVKQAFVFGFRLIMVICAVLAAASAGFAWWMIKAPSSRYPAGPTQSENP
jgi:hypothetical protein